MSWINRSLYYCCPVGCREHHYTWCAVRSHCVSVELSAHLPSIAKRWAAQTKRHIKRWWAKVISRCTRDNGNRLVKTWSGRRARRSEQTAESGNVRDSTVQPSTAVNGHCCISTSREDDYTLCFWGLDCICMVAFCNKTLYGCPSIHLMALFRLKWMNIYSCRRIKVY